MDTKDDGQQRAKHRHTITIKIERIDGKDSPFFVIHLVQNLKKRFLSKSPFEIIQLIIIINSIFIIIIQPFSK